MGSGELGGEEGLGGALGWEGALRRWGTGGGTRGRGIQKEGTHTQMPSNKGGHWGPPQPHPLVLQ